MKPKRHLLVWADKLVLLVALLIAGTALLCWVLGIIGLEGRSNPRFDGAIIDWTVSAELMLIVPLWLFLRILDFGAKALGRWLRLSPRRDDKVGAGGW